jgi:hypothetical protein
VANRDKLKALRDFVREGDAIVVTKPDRLTRSTAELLATEADVSKRGHLFGHRLFQILGRPLQCFVVQLLRSPAEAVSFQAGELKL